MTARDLFEAVGLVDEELIEDADAAAPRRRPVLTLRRALPLAACLCLAAGAAFAWRASPWNGAGTQSEAATAPQMAAAPDTAAAAPEQQAAGGVGLCAEPTAHLRPVCLEGAPNGHHSQ